MIYLHGIPVNFAPTKCTVQKLLDKSALINAP